MTQSSRPWLPMQSFAELTGRKSSKAELDSWAISGDDGENSRTKVQNVLADSTVKYPSRPIQFTGIQIMDYRFCPNDGTQLVIDASEHEGRPWCHRCGFIQYPNPVPCVAVLIVRDGKLLLSKRGIEPKLGSWDIPGGFIQWNEAAEEAAARECEEELSVRVNILDYLGSIPDVYGPHNVPTLNMCFLGRISAGEPSPRSDVDDLDWFDPDDVPDKMAFAHQRRALDWLRAQLHDPNGLRASGDV